MTLMPGVIHDLTTTTRDMAAIDGIVIHTIVGFWSGGKAAHWTTDAQGTIRQHRDTTRQSAANLDGNPRWLAIENEDHGSAYGAWNTSDGHAVPSFTDAQCNGIARIIAWVHRVHNVPLDPVPDTKPGRRGIAYHRQGIKGNYDDYAYGGWTSGGVLFSNQFGKVCPGDRRISQLINVIIPRARTLAGLGAQILETDVGNLGIPLYSTIDAGPLPYVDSPTVARDVLVLPGPARDPGSRLRFTTGWGQTINVTVWYLGEGSHNYLGPEGGNGHRYVVRSDTPDWAPIPNGTVAVHVEWSSTEPIIPGDLRVVFIPAT